MTLQDKLKMFKEENNYGYQYLQELTGLSRVTLTRIIKRDLYSASTAYCLYKAMGEEYKEYVYYRKCKFCGEDFVPYSQSSDVCKNPDCRRKHANEINKKVYYKAKAEGRQWATAGTESKDGIKSDKKAREPVQGFKEFMNGRSYGDAQRELLLMKQKEQRMTV